MAIGSLADTRVAIAQTALLAGQSNARDQTKFLPPTSYVAVVKGNTSNKAWDRSTPDGELGRELLRQLTAHQFKVFIWWQGETDGLEGMPAEEYRERLKRILDRVNLPTIIVDMADHPSRVALRRVQREFADSPTVALIDTVDLPMINLHDFEDAGRPTVTDRIMRCYFVECWILPGKFK